VAVWDVVEFRPEPTDPPRTAVADDRGSQYWFNRTPFGTYFQGLTQDDVGGLRYLLSTNNVNFEILLGDVQGTGTNATNYVNGALRPGVDKITFVRQQYDPLSNLAVPITNQFTDNYVSNNVRMSQQVERVVTVPDFLFTAEDFPKFVGLQARNVTGTSNWWNSATVAGNPGAGGPGVIRPPAKIGFDRLVPVVESGDNGAPITYCFRWGSFDGSTNTPIAYPEGAGFEGANRLSIHLWLVDPPQYGSESYWHWWAPIPLGGEAWVQTSTNLTEWTSALTITNFAGSIIWEHFRSLPKGFFRVVPK